MRVVPEPKVIQVKRFHYGVTDDNPKLRMDNRPKPVSKQALRKSVSAEDDNLFDDIPGMKHLLDAEKPVWFKSLWSLILLMSTCLCIYQISDRVKLYLSNPVLSETKLLFNSTITAPSITICPRTVDFHRSWFESYGCICHGAETLDCCYAFLCLIDGCNTTQIWNAIHYKRILNNIMFYEKNSLEKTINISMTLKDIVTVQGTCVTAKFGEPIPFHGNRLQLLTVLDVNKPDCNTRTPGRLFLHEDNVDMTYLTGGIELHFNYETFNIYGLSVRTFQALNRREDPCASIEEINKCKIRCIEQKILDLGVNCSLPYMTMTKNINPCTDFHSAIYTFIKTIQVTSTINYEADCKCPRKCKSSMYTIFYQSKKNVLHSSISLYFNENLVKHTIEYYSYSLIAMLCDLGGNLGLYLGLCIPAIIDIIQSMIMFVFKKFR